MTPLRKYAAFIILWFLTGTSGKLFCQDIKKDTLKLPEFEIKSNFIIDNQGFKRIRIDSAILAPRINTDLSAILSDHSSIFIKSYGNGTLATSSFRGTAAQHTQVEWNGINLNSPMLGQVDLSQIRVSQFEGLEILYGAAGISRTAGAFGGVIDLVTTPDWNNRLNFMASQTLGSFDTYCTNLAAATGGKRFQSHSKLNYTSSLNNFPYHNDTGIVRQRKSSFKHYDLSQEFYVRIHDKHLVSARVWYSNDDRNLPPGIHNSDPDYEETQKDHSLRAIVEYKYAARQGSILVRSALVDQYMHYFQKDIVDSEHKTLSWINRVRYTYSGIKNLTIKPGLDFNYDRVNSKSYKEIKKRNTAGLFAEVGYTPGKHIKASLVLREELIDGKFQPFVPALGVEYRPFPRQNLAFSANISRNYRYPTMNDLFWEIYGNKDLKTEKNFGIECGSTWNSGESVKDFFVELAISAYYSRIRDMITWMPDETSSLYRPLNVPQVLSRGLEAGINLKTHLLGFDLGVVGSYNFCKSTYEKVNDSIDDKLGKQLMYIPVHTLNASVSIERWKFYCHYNFYFVSDRYTGNDNLSFMPSYYLSNIILGKNIGLRNFVLSLQLEINNVMDLDYQSIANRPMPGINYAFTLKLAMPGVKSE